MKRRIPYVPNELRVIGARFFRSRKSTPGYASHTPREYFGQNFPNSKVGPMRSRSRKLLPIWLPEPWP